MRESNTSDAEPPATKAASAPVASPAPRTPRPSDRETSSVTSRTPMTMAVLAIVVVLAALALLLLLPAIVRSRAIATARRAGFAMTIERVGVGLDGISLRGVKTKALRAPGISASIDEVYVTGLTASAARVRGMDAHVTGRPEEVEKGLAIVLADIQAQLGGTASTPRRLSVVGARVTWEDLAGAGSRLLAGDIGVELDSRGPSATDVHGNIGRFEIQTRRTTLGPWTSSFEASPTRGRVRLVFDPPVPDGPSALVVWGGRSGPELTMRIPRSTFANLGIKPAEVGLPADRATEVAVNLTGQIAGDRRIRLAGDASLWGARPRGLSSPIDVRLQGAASGLPGQPFEFDKVTATVDPFVAGLGGTLTPHDDGLRIDATFKVVPISCEKLAIAEAKSMGPLAATLQALGQSTGALRVTGTVNASGVVSYDTADPGQARVTWLAKETCGVSIFGL